MWTAKDRYEALKEWGKRLSWRLWGYWRWRGFSQAEVAWWLYVQESNAYKAGGTDIRPEYLHDYSIKGSRYAEAAVAMTDAELKAHLAVIALEEAGQTP